MGNLDFLEKKIKYDLIWDGITEGKVSVSSSNTPTYYLISEKDYAPDNVPDELKSLTSGTSSAKQNNIDVVFNWTLADNDDPNSIEHGKNLATLFKLEGNDAINCVFFCKTDDFSASLCYAAYDGANFGNGTLNPNHGVEFPKKGWYINDFGIANTKLATVEMPKKNPVINISGKGFTSPQKPYRQFARPFESDDDILIAINDDVLPNEVSPKFFNAFCVPGSPSTQADIKLDENLANIISHSNVNLLSVAFYSSKIPDNYNGAIRSNYYMFNTCRVVVGYDDDDSNPGMTIRVDGTLRYFNSSITQHDIDDWYDKYLSTTF